jgi:hypothetical protein
MIKTTELRNKLANGLRNGCFSVRRGQRQVLLCSILRGLFVTLRLFTNFQLRSMNFLVHALLYLERIWRCWNSGRTTKFLNFVLHDTLVKQILAAYTELCARTRTGGQNAFNKQAFVMQWSQMLSLSSGNSQICIWEYSDWHLPWAFLPC